VPLTGPTTDHNEIRDWADLHQVVPAELLPHQIDHEPSVLRLMLVEQARTRLDLRLITWEEFFMKFDLLGLTFIYDQDPRGYCELLQEEERSPYRRPEYRSRTAFQN
jgi:hypothetical protein